MSEPIEWIEEPAAAESVHVSLPLPPPSALQQQQEEPEKKQDVGEVVKPKDQDIKGVDEPVKTSEDFVKSVDQPYQPVRPSEDFVKPVEPISTPPTSTQPPRAAEHRHRSTYDLDRPTLDSAVGSRTQPSSRSWADPGSGTAPARAPAPLEHSPSAEESPVLQRRERRRVELEPKLERSTSTSQKVPPRPRKSSPHSSAPAPEPGAVEQPAESAESQQQARLTSQQCKDDNGFVYYKCRFCGLTYNYITTLKAHERVHDVMQPYACNKCGESFHYACELEYHAKTHMGEWGRAGELHNIWTWSMQVLQVHVAPHVMLRNFD